MRTNVWVGCVVLAVAAVATGCLDIVGYKERTLDSAGGGGAGGSAGSGGTVTGGTGGAGGAQVCVPGEKQPCYTAAVATENVGVCKGGTQTCDADGMGFGECVGEVTPTKEDCSTTADEDCGGLACGEVIDAAQLSGVQLVRSVVGANGDIYVAGSFGGTITIGNDMLAAVDKLDVFVAKMSPSGDWLWARAFGGPEKQFLHALVADSVGSVYIGVANLGTFAADPYSTAQVLSVTKIDQAGNPLWMAPCGGEKLGTTATKAFLRRLEIGASNDVLVAASFQGTMDFGTGVLTASQTSEDGAIARLDGLTGATKWAFRYGSQFDEHWVDLASRPDGHFFVAGQGVEGTSLNGQTLSGAGTSFVALFTPEGAPVWTTMVGNMSSSVNIARVATSNDGGAFLAGAFTGAFSFGANAPILDAMGGTRLFIAKMDGVGNHVWSGSPGDSLSGYFVGDLASGPSGNVVFGGSFQGTMKFGQKTYQTNAGAGFVSMLAGGTGDPIWSFALTGALSHNVNNLGASSDGTFVASGDFEGAISLGPETFFAQQGVDVFVARIAP